MRYQSWNEAMRWALVARRTAAYRGKYYVFKIPEAQAASRPSHRWAISLFPNPYTKHGA